MSKTTRFVCLFLLIIASGCGGDKNGAGDHDALTNRIWADTDNQPGVVENYIYFGSDGAYYELYMFPVGGNSSDCESNPLSGTWEFGDPNFIVTTDSGGDVDQIYYYELQSLASHGNRLLLYEGKRGYRGGLEYALEEVSSIPQDTKDSCCRGSWRCPPGS